MVQRLEAQRERHRHRPLVVRVLYIAVGFTLLGAGAAMLILPGPAFVVIPIGLAVLSLEFAWAEKLLHKALVQGEVAKRRAAETTTTERILVGAAATLAIGAIVVWGILGDIPLLPM